MFRLITALVGMVVATQAVNIDAEAEQSYLAAQEGTAYQGSHPYYRGDFTTRKQRKAGRRSARLDRRSQRRSLRRQRRAARK